MPHHAPATLDIAWQHGLATIYLDTCDPRRNCPGFYLWAIDVDGVPQLMAADSHESLHTRVYFRTDGQVSIDTTTAVPLGPNPDKDEWLRLRGETD